MSLFLRFYRISVHNTVPKDMFSTSDLVHKCRTNGNFSPKIKDHFYGIPLSACRNLICISTSRKQKKEILRVEKSMKDLNWNVR